LHKYFIPQESRCLAVTLHYSTNVLFITLPEMDNRQNYIIPTRDHSLQNRILMMHSIGKNYQEGT
jgi:hypothetical protein